MIDDAALEAEALRVYRRYMTEIVEGLNLCPWAAKARREGHVTERVLLCPEPSVDASLAAIDELAADEMVEIGLLIYPRLSVARLPFEEFVAEIRVAEERRHEIGEVPFAMAAFHPEAAPDLGNPERLIPFIRRSPDPTIQLVHRDVLDRVRSGTADGTSFVDLDKVDPETLLGGEPEVPLRERVARTNADTIKDVGVAEVEAMLADIRRDRDESYARLVR